VGSWGGLDGVLLARESALVPMHVAELGPRQKVNASRAGGQRGVRRPSEAKRLDGSAEDGLTTTPAWSSFPRLARSFQAPRGWTLKEELRRLPPRFVPPTLDPTRPHAAIEELTAPFRIRLAMAHTSKARIARRGYVDAIDAWGEGLDGFDVSSLHELTDVAAARATTAVSTEKWHTCRAQGQLYRFDRVRTCGMRTLIATCKGCGEDRRSVKETCDVRRVCESCDVDNAKTRRARFGRARGVALLVALRHELFRANRAGGRYGEKMLTLTVPHVEFEDTGGELREKASCTIDARIRALFSAWPRFLRKVNRWWKSHRQFDVRYHRAFEWTHAADGKGHPHFHVYILCPFVDVALIREWWAESLRQVGCPVEHDRFSDRSTVMVDLRVLRVPDASTVRELLKGGKRSAIELSHVTFDKDRPLYLGGRDAWEYADGWTLGEVKCADDVRAQLYMSLEGRRLTQASRGFFVEDDPPECECCGGREFRVRFEVCEHTLPCGSNVGTLCLQERGPPS
jgi:hypothetical protein